MTISLENDDRYIMQNILESAIASGDLNEEELEMAKKYSKMIDEELYKERYERKEYKWE